MVLVVLGAPCTDDGRPGKALLRRLRVALERALDDPSALVVVSGGAVVNRHAEGEVMAAWLVEQGIAKERVRIERSARNTTENARLTMALLGDVEIARLVIVTETFHLPRSLYLFRAALRAARIHGVPVEGAAAETVATPSKRIALSLIELVKLARDALRGGMGGA